MSPRTSAFLAAGGVFALDRATKIWVERSVSMWETIVVIPGFFQIIHTQNRGIVFGLFSEAEGLLRTTIVFLATAVALIALTAWLWRLPEDPPGGRTYTRPALALILGGAAGNLYDRLLQGAVTDFLDFHLAGYHWPAFNIADSAITVGAGLILLELLPARRDAASGGR